MTVTLPDDVLFIILDFLKIQKEYNTIFQCAMSCRWLAEPALSVLYQLYDTSPVIGGGTEDEQRIKRATGKWALMWRSIILSTFDRTYLPYYSYIRYLDLNDLKELLNDHLFRGEIRNDFFLGELHDYDAKDPTDTIWIIEKIGSAITRRAKSIKELSGEIPASSLSQWVRGLPQLQALSLWAGNSLGGNAEEEIRSHCPDFKKLTLFRWMNNPLSDAQTESERFLKGLRPNSLEYFEVFSSSQLGPRSISAMQTHLDSLVELKLTNLPIEAIAELPSLTALPALRVLVLTDSIPTLKNEEFYRIVSSVSKWICSCKSLRRLELRRFVDDPALLAEALVSRELRLTRLSVGGYSMNGNRAFHEALTSQSGLQSLSLQGDPNDVIEDQSVLVQALAQLGCLYELELKDISDNFTPSHVVTLTPFLPRLERLFISGYNFGNDELNCFLCLPRLRYLVINALSYFTAEGILNFISQLGPGNQGFHLTILSNSMTYDIDKDAEALIRDTLIHNLNGDFDLVPFQDEYMDSGSDSSQ